jgi:hypothetical protein
MEKAAPQAPSLGQIAIGLESNLGTAICVAAKPLCRDYDNTAIKMALYHCLTENRAARGDGLCSYAERLIVRYRCHAFYA